MYRDNPEATVPQALSPDDRALLRKLFPAAADLAAALDHTLLKPEATEAQVLALAQEAAEHRFACAMVNPAWVPTAARALAGTGVRVGTVVGFPLGASFTATKRAEAVDAARAGALDIDMVLNIGFLRSGLLREVGDEIRTVAEAAHGEGAILKVILETALLSDDEKRAGSMLCVEAGAEFVKTSTGFASGGATAGDVALLRAAIGSRCGVKASGGIRTLLDALRMAAAGADRIGASASVAILASYRALELADPAR